jgi:hypothetical protein
MSEFGTKRHCRRAERSPLLGVKRTSQFQSAMSAFDPKRTLVPPSFGVTQGTAPNPQSDIL